MLVNRLNCFFGLNWEANPNRASGGAADILIGCVDTIAARRTLAAFSYAYWLDLGNSATTGQVILGAAKPQRSGFTRQRMKAGKLTKSERATEAAYATRPLNFFELFPHLRRLPSFSTGPSTAAVVSAGWLALRICCASVTGAFGFGSGRTVPL